MDKRNFTNGQEIPMGLGMAMAQNIDAMNYFANLDDAGKQQIIEHAHNVHSKREMQAFVNNMANFKETSITDSPEDPYNGIYL